MNILKDDFLLSNSAGYVVNIVANRMKQELETSFVKHGYNISAMQWMILNTVYENDGIVQKELSSISKKDKTNITRIIDKLIKKGFIKRVRDEDDKRVYKVFITQVGKDIRFNLSQIAKNVLERTSRGISEDEYISCLNTLKKFYSNLE